MKKLFFLATCLICFMLLVGTDASAYTILNGWTLDLNAAVAGLDTVNDVYYLNWDSPGLNTTSITQYLGGDATLNNGDSFIETGYMQLFTVGTSGPTHSLDLLAGSTQYYAFAVFQNVTGTINNYSNEGTPLDPTDDTWDYTFDTGSGTVGLYLDLDTNPFNGTAVTLLTGTIIPQSDGTADGFLNGPGPGVLSNWGITLQGTSAAPGVWKDTDGVTDLWTKYGTKGWLLALPQGVTQLDGNPTSGFDPVKGEVFVAFSGHTGDTMKLAVVPEPTTMLLLGMGVLGLVPVVRRKKAA